MKPKHHRFFLQAPLTSILFTGVMLAGVHGADLEWIPGNTGSFTDPANYNPAVAPVDGDQITANGTGSIINYGGTTITLSNLNLNNSGTGGNVIFNQSGGALSLTMLSIGGNGNLPTYNLTGGTVTTTNINPRGIYLQSGGVMTTTGTGNYTSSNGGVGSSFTLSDQAVFNTNTATLQLANGNNASGTITLSGSAQMNLTKNDGRLVLGQFGNEAVGTLNISDSATLTAASIVLGNNNASNRTNGVINLNGGTITTGVIRKGATSLASSLTQIVLHANGGTIRASSASTNFLQNLYVNLLPGGLKLDTNSLDVTVTNVLAGQGGLTKLGTGNLTLSTTTGLHEGSTTVSAGQLTLKGAVLNDAAAVSVDTGATLHLDFAGEDLVGALTLGGVTQAGNTTYGAVGSGAAVTSPLLTGTGIIRVAAANTNRTLTWTGASNSVWDTSSENFVDGSNTPATFTPGDNVIFSNSTATPLAITISGLVEPSSVTFNGTGEIALTGVGSGIAGPATVTKNGTGAVTLGGTASTFAGEVLVNEGKLAMGDSRAFGASAGITIVAGAQVDIAGKSTPPIYSYTIAGDGPDGTGAIINSGGDLLENSGIRHLTLSADAAVGSGGRIDIGGGGLITGNDFTLTKVGTGAVFLRGFDTGSPIHYVVESGSLNAQNDSTFGGATGTLRIQSGAAAGTFGNAKIVAAAVTIEDGGRLRTLGGGGQQSWTGPILAEGEATLESNASDNLVISGSFTGTANLTKIGGGTVTLNQPGHAGNTTVTAGTLAASTGFSDTHRITLGSVATLSLAGTEPDIVGSFVDGGAAGEPGIWGSYDHPTAQYRTLRIAGAGSLQVSQLAVENPTGANLVWTGAGEGNVWMVGGGLNFLDGVTPSAFADGDHVLFDDTGVLKDLSIFGTIAPSSITFDNTNDPYYLFGEFESKITGLSGIVKNGSNLVWILGDGNDFGGRIRVNAGILMPASNTALGRSAEIIVADGAQVDLNGTAPGPIYTYTLSGTGPDGAGQLVNSGGALFQSGGVRNVILTGNTTIGGGSRFDIGGSGVIRGNGFALTKIGTSDMAVRGDAGSTPIHFVAAAGQLFAETSDNAFGGNTGSLTVLSGATGGTFGTRTIATPVTIADGGRLANIGGGLSKWSGKITLEGVTSLFSPGGAALDTDGIEISGVVEGSGGVTKTGAGRVKILSVPQYTGDTVIEQGRLHFSSAGLSDAGNVNIAATGILEIPTGAEDTVATLTLAGVAAPAGSVWGALDNTSVPEGNRTALIEGNGTLRVTGGIAPSGYPEFTSEFSLTGEDAGVNADPDQDGISNGIEFVLGTSPIDGDLTEIPAVGTDATHLIFTFRRAEVSMSYGPHAEYSTSLAEGSWTDAIAGTDDVAISSAPAETGVELVTVRIPKSLAAEGKLFVRLAVTITNP